MTQVHTWNRPHDIPAGTVIVRTMASYNGKAEDAAQQEWRAVQLVGPLGGTLAQSFAAPLNSWTIDIRCAAEAAPAVTAALKAGGFSVNDDENRAAAQKAAKRANRWMP